MPEQFTEHLNLPLPSAGNPLSEDVGRIAAAFTALDAAVHQGTQGASQIAQNLESLGETVGGLEQGLSNLDNSKMPANRVASSSVLGGVKVGGGLVISEAGALAVSGDAYYDKPQINSLLPLAQKIGYEARSSNTALTPADKGKLIDLTGGGWTQTLQAAATLGAGWYCYLRYVTQLGPFVDTWNGSFSTDALWTKGSGWSISGGKANGSSTSAVLTSTASPIIAGRRYRVTYTTSNITLGWIVVGVGGVADTSRSTNGTYVFEATATTTALLITGTSFTGSVDNITITDLTTTAITVCPNGSELIDGVVSGQLRFGQSILVVCTGAGFVCQSVHTNTITEFINSGTSWVCPLGVRSVEVTLVGGGNAAPDAYREGVGGLTTIARQAVHPSKTYAYTVGAGGAYPSGSGGSSGFIENGVTLQSSNVTPINGYLASGYKNPNADSAAIGGPSFGGGMGYGRGGAPGGAGSAGGIILRY